jgi:hypothetical protein
VDVAGEAHKKAGLPPDLDSAVALAGAMPRPPSLGVSSGHGCYPWWLFERPWVFADDGDRQKAARLVRGWQKALNRLGRERGWRMDGTADLARVLRLPGTVNRKLVPVPVTVELPAQVRRYAVAELLEALGGLPEREALFQPPPRQARPVTGQEGALALQALQHLSEERRVEYDQWLAVGMALHSVSEELLGDWDEWSEGCQEKYEPGACEAKWETFRQGGGLTLGSLIHWAKQDTGWLPPLPPKRRIRSALHCFFEV